MECPMCHKDIEEFHRVWSDAPFTAKAGLEGLLAWGGYGVERVVLCQSDRFVHFRFVVTNKEHLVEMVPDLDKKRAIIREHHKSQKHGCDQAGCENEGEPGWSMWGEEEPLGFYCWDHAYENGFCPGCMTFMAGIESFDFSSSGLCANCEADLEPEWEDEDELEFDDFMGYSD